VSLCVFRAPLHRYKQPELLRYSSAAIAVNPIPTMNLAITDYQECGMTIPMDLPEFNLSLKI
jgi:hypothetical protein